MTSIINPIAFAVCSAVLLCALTASAAGIERTTVWTRGQGNYKVYRIPSALVTKAGTLLTFCEGRQTPKGSDSGEINLIVKRSSDNGKTFSGESVVWADGANTCGNPCPVVDQSTGTIWMLMTRNLGDEHEKDIIAGKSKERRTVWVTSSSDDGKTWEKPHEITADVSKPDWMWYATGPGVGIQIQRGAHAGRLVIPCDHIRRGGGPNAGNSHVIYSDDHGKTWKLGGEAPQSQFNESQVAELSDGRLMLNMRNHRSGADGAHERGVCISDDGGETFKDLKHDPVLIEPICQASILRVEMNASAEALRRGEEKENESSPRLSPRLSASALALILFANPASDSKRINMTVRVSQDDGLTWAASKEIYAGPSAYSCLVALPDGSIGLLYECGEKNSYERIELARFTMQWLSEKP